MTGSITMLNMTKTQKQHVETLRTPLNSLVEQYGSTYVHTDPIQFVYRYKDPQNRELIGFLCALLAFGNVKAIFSSIEKLLNFLGKNPLQQILSWPHNCPKLLFPFYHRWITGKDLHVFFKILRNIYGSHGSLEAFFMEKENLDRNLKAKLDSFAKRIQSMLCREVGGTLNIGQRFLLSSPSQGSACKRLNLFLRWMVRKTAPDLGLWTTISPDQLYLPIDTHLGKIVRYIGLTRRKSVNWKMVEEVTSNLRELDHEDPIRYDFALARLGILDRCRHRADPDCCPFCALVHVCLLNRGKYT